MKILDQPDQCHYSFLIPINLTSKGCRNNFLIKLKSGSISLIKGIHKGSSAEITLTNNLNHPLVHNGNVLEAHIGGIELNGYVRIDKDANRVLKVYECLKSNDDNFLMHY